MRSDLVHIHVLSGGCIPTQLITIPIVKLVIPPFAEGGLSQASNKNSFRGLEVTSFRHCVGMIT